VAFGVFYIALIVALILSDFQYASWQDITNSLADENVRYSIWLSLITCTISAIVSMWFAIPIGYVLARLGRDAIERKFARRPIMRRLAMLVRYLVDTLLDIPIVLPPLVVGISLLILFQTSLGRWLDDSVQSMFSILGYRVGGITYEIPAIVLSQFTVAAAFAIRTMRGTFEQISEEPELVALTLGASRSQGFCRVAMPQAWRGSVAAFTLAWARSLGEFGPILIFAGTARMKTEVLSTTVYLSFQSGNLRGAVAASLILVTLAIVALVFTRLLTLGNGSGNGPAGGVVA
jgi:molybdate transport system permease protein